MHYLVALWDGGGTVPVEIGVVRRLVDRGHSVTVLGDPTLASPVSNAGASFVPWRDAPHRTADSKEGDLLKDWECRTPLEVFARIRDRLVTGPALEFATEVVRELGERPADVVVASGPVLGALVGAEAARVPAVVLCSNIYIRPAPGLPPFGSGFRAARTVLGRTRDRLVNAGTTRMWNTGLADLNAARQHFRLPALRSTWEQWDSAARVLVLTSRIFDYPARLPDNVRYVGPILDDPGWARGTVESVADRFPPGLRDAPLVVVALSSTYNRQEAVIGRIISGLSGMRVRGIASTGPAIGAPAAQAPNVVVLSSLSHREAFPRASAVITHGGHGSVIKALAAGVPVLCLPMGRDQRDNAVRAERLGAGLILSKRATPRRIASAVTALLTEPAYAEGAQEAGRRIRQEIDHSSLLRELEEAAGARPAL